MNPLKVFAKTISTKVEDSVHTPAQRLFDLKINRIDGSELNWNDFKGKHLLLVNVASKCGFTPQYKSLQKLYEAHKDKLEIIGFPCNQFGGQEPGNAEEIQSFCEMNFGVSFTLTEKIDVKGANQHPVYTWLTKKRKNGIKDSTVKWNFHKFMVSPEGKLLDNYGSMTKPMSSRITKYLKD